MAKANANYEALADKAELLCAGYEQRWAKQLDEFDRLTQKLQDREPLRQLVERMAGTYAELANARMDVERYNRLRSKSDVLHVD